MKRSKSQYAFQVFDIVFMVLIMATIIVPILNILSLSVSSADAIRSGSVTFYPKGFSLDAYKDIIGNRLFASSVYNTVFTTVVGTVLAVTVTLLVAYALTKDFVGKKYFAHLLTFLMSTKAETFLSASLRQAFAPGSLASPNNTSIVRGFT